MRICHRGDNGQRLAGHRHEPELGHDECEPCPGVHCHVCGTLHVDPDTPAHPTTCPRCVGAIRGDLRAVELLTAYLPAQAAYGGADGRLEASRPIPGGDAQVMLAWGSTTTTSAADESSGDPIPPLLLLASWEDSWRVALGHPGGPRPTMPAVTGYLHQHLTWAAQRHPAIDDFAREVRQCRARLEDVLSAGERDDTVAAPCFDCGGQLVRRVTDAGRQDRYQCRRCHRDYNVASYWLAVADHAEEEAAG